jgi:hypothetical protein
MLVVSHLPASPSDLIQYGKDAHWPSGRHLTRSSIVNVVWESRQIREMRHVIPTPDQLVVGIGLVIAVGDHRNLPSRGALHIFGKLELAAIDQRKPSANMSIHQRRALTYHLEAGDDWIVTKRSCIASR